MMPPKRRLVRRGESRQQRKAERQTYLGPLRNFIVSRQMQKLYHEALLMFHWFIGICCLGLDCTDVVALGRALCHFLELAWEEGEPMSLAGDTTSGLRHAINRRRVFPGAWRYFSAWSRSELPNRTPPLHD